ncbi:hypothetical protein BDR06DRAFT_1005967 [Suillus hirtellus]|nr:hypothetical protein BDR06DRAFT_1005967 [Suillus hirtellus]
MAIPIEVLCKLRNIPTDGKAVRRRVISESHLSPPHSTNEFISQDLNILSPPKFNEKIIHTNTRFIQQKTTTQKSLHLLVPPQIYGSSTITPPALPTVMSTNIPTITPQPTFYGDYEKGEEPTNWMRNYQLSFPPSYLDAKKIMQFELQYAAASPAEAWYATLMLAETASWSMFLAAFRKRWPPPLQVTLMVTQKKDRIQAIVLEDEIGVMIEEDRGREWGHVKWAKTIARTVQGFSDTQCHLLDVVLENTLEVLRDFLADNYTLWSDFESDVAKISASQLDRAKQWMAMEKKLRSNIDKLQSQVTNNRGKMSTPVQSQQVQQGAFAPPAYQYGYRQTPASVGQPPQIFQPTPVAQLMPQQAPIMQTPQVPQTPHAAALFSTPAPINRGNLFYGYRGGIPQMPTRGRGGSIADQARVAIQFATIPHQPDSEMGRQTYMQQVQDWHTAHRADAIPNSSRPYPLKPGTTPLGSRECFNCRLATNPSHQAYECTYPAVPVQEMKWRETVSCLVTRALTTTPATGAPTNVQFMAPMQPQNIL